MTRLSVNVNKIATLRNTRTIGIPSIVQCSRICLDAGAHGITVHPRPDQRHIRPGDVKDLSQLLKKYPQAEFNIEGNPFFEYMHFARDYRPDQCTLVSDLPEAETSDRGWDLKKDGERLRPIISELKSWGCRVSLFLDTRLDMIDIAKKLGADRIELYTAPYAHAFAENHLDELEKYAAAARRAKEVGLGLNAGHDLNLSNLPRFLKALPSVEEVSIGHALISDALQWGLEATVKRYLSATGN
jgi:pyridoxine 5-phosphate synthase